MDTTQIIEIVKATAGSASVLINQVAWFFAIQQAAQWLSFSFPLLMLFSVMHKLRSKFPETSAGAMGLVAWILLALAIGTGVRGAAHLAQASLAPTVYAAEAVGSVQKLMETLKK